MGRIVWLIVVTAALLASSMSLWSQQNDSQGQTQSAAQAAPAGQDSLAEAARKAREEKKEAPKKEPPKKAPPKNPPPKKDKDPPKK